jgi:hypothetical protein
MTPILSTLFKSHHVTIDAGHIQAYLDDLIEGSPALLPYRYALVEVAALKTDSRIEIYEDQAAGKDSGRIWLPEGATVKPNTVCLLWLPDSRSAALKPYDTGEWQWTRASNPQDALRLPDGALKGERSEVDGSTRPK